MLDTKPNYDDAMKRVEAWFHCEVLDRPPARFARHNAQYEEDGGYDIARWPTRKEWWFDAEYQVENFVKNLEGQPFRAETFPVFWPNLGPDIYAAFFGSELEFGDVTSWSEHVIHDIEDDEQLGIPAFSEQNPYLLKIEEMTRLALDAYSGKALTGITCWCPGIDTVSSWLGPQDLCIAMMTEPERVKMLTDRTMEPFQSLADRFYAMIRERGLPSVGWMEIPWEGTCHIAQTDFANMISPDQFREFCQPWLREEIATMDKVIFHMDGPGVANHVDELIAEPGIDAIQWCQGVGDDEPIMQWVPLIQKIQQGGKAAVIDLKPAELEPFMDAVSPEGIFLCIAAEDEIQDDILKRLKKWK